MELIEVHMLLGEFRIILDFTTFMQLRELLEPCFVALLSMNTELKIAFDFLKLKRKYISYVNRLYK